MNFALITVVLALIWASITASFSPLNLFLGAVVGMIALWVVRDQVSRPTLLRQTKRISSLVVLFFYELALSAVRVAWLVIQPDLKGQLQPGFIAYPLNVKTDVEVTLLANLITLTPGTLSVDVSDDKKYIYVHALSVPNKKELIAGIKDGFEAKIIEVSQ